ncbi:MAG: hypothetical protein WCD53_28965, partial [Microcoleus sp.]
MIISIFPLEMAQASYGLLCFTFSNYRIPLVTDLWAIADSGTIGAQRSILNNPLFTLWSVQLLNR